MPPPGLNRLTQGLRPEDRNRIRHVRVFAVSHLSSIRRRSGESYAEHGCEVAATLRQVTDDPSLIAAAILNDLLLHPEGHSLLLASPLLPNERTLVRRMSKLRRLHIDLKTKDLDTLMEAFLQDTRLLLLRMAHRVNDIRHLERFDTTLRRSIAHETLHMYAAIAGRLGMIEWRQEMEDCCFPVVQPAIARKMRKAFASRAALDAACLRHARSFLLKKLRAKGIHARCEQRIKGQYSTYRKMIVKHRTFDELTDRIALRVIVGSADECYRTLGIVHSLFHLIPGKLKDYIGMPKENGYQSIHTVIYPLPGVTEQPIEIQIRTEGMDHVCERGSASHGDYKQRLYSLRSGSGRVDAWRTLQHLREETRSAREFERALRTYFREDQITIFDAQNRLYHLHTPATALDFACHAFDVRAAHVKSVRINGREHPLDTVLHSGDTVEVRCGKARHIREQWLRACRHQSSRSLLRGLLHAE